MCAVFTSLFIIYFYLRLGGKTGLQTGEQDWWGEKGKEKRDENTNNCSLNFGKNLCVMIAFHKCIPGWLW